MSTQVQYRRGTNAQNAAFTGALAEITVDTTNGTLRVHDGITAGGSNIATVSYVTEQIGALSANSISSGTSSVSVITTNGNIRSNVAGSTVQTISAGLVAITGDLSVTGNATLSGNILGDRIQNGTTTIDIQTPSGNANITVGATSNVAVFSTAGANITGTLGVTGNITGSFILGNGSQLTGIDATSIQSGTSNVRVVSSGGNVTTSVGGTANVVVVTTTGANIAGTLNATGNANVGNLGATTVVATTLTGTLSTAAQTNITSVGTLGALTVTGNVAGGNITTGGQVVATGNVSGGNLLINGNAVITGNLRVDGTETIFNVQTLSVNDKDIIVANNVTGGANVNGAGLQAGNPAVATWFFNNATTSWQSNIAITPTANGTLSLGAASNYWGSAFVTTITATGNANVGNIGATNVVATNLTGTLQTAAQTNITSVGTLGSLAVTGNISGANLNFTGNLVDTAALEIITGSNGNITLSPNGSGLIVANKDIRNGQANGVGNIGTVGGFFNTIFAKATSAQYADLAEMYVADADYPPGTVVEFGGEQEITISSSSHSTAVAGIVSTNPSYLMNSTQQGEHVLPIALTGRVPCRVQGPVRKGDVLVASSTPGVAQRIGMNWQPGCVVGKSMAVINTAEIQTIEVAVGRL